MFRSASVFLLLATALSIQEASRQTPDTAADSRLQSFYVAGFGPSAELTIIDVQSSRGSSSVRFIRVYPACDTFRVRAEKHVFDNASAADLAGTADLCTTEKTFTAAIKVVKRKGVQEEWLDQYAIVSRCGSETRVHRLFWPEYLYFNALKKRAPRIAELWSVPENIRHRYDRERQEQGSDADFGTAEERQRASEQAVIDIRGGDFDLAVPELPPGMRREGKFKLSELVPEMIEATGPEEDFGVVENLDHLAVEKQEAIRYPSLARIAHIQGDVNLQVSVDSATGSTTGVNPVSGHPILIHAATESITKWVFRHPYAGANPVSVKVHFAIHCAPIIQPSSTAVEKSRKGKKKKRNRD